MGVQPVGLTASAVRVSDATLGLRFAGDLGIVTPCGTTSSDPRVFKGFSSAGADGRLGESAVPVLYASSFGQIVVFAEAPQDSLAGSGRAAFLMILSFSSRSVLENHNLLSFQPTWMIIS